jgi:Immunity protein 8
MKAVLKKLISLEIEDKLELFWPSDIHDFGTWIKLMIGPDDEVGTEYFDIFVCTPAWLKAEAVKNGAVWGHHMLIVNKYDLDDIKAKISWRIDRCSGNTWSETALNISQYAAWEFEKYKH